MWLAERTCFAVAILLVSWSASVHARGLQQVIGGRLRVNTVGRLVLGLFPPMQWFVVPLHRNGWLER